MFNTHGKQDIIEVVNKNFIFFMDAHIHVHELFF